jgi:hypothetical protein
MATKSSRSNVPKPDPKPHVDRYVIEPVACRLMERHVILAVVELTELLRVHFAGQFSAVDLLPNQEGKKPRLVWENELDWVKATWTDRGRTIKVKFRNQHCLVWMPKVIGSITEGQGGHLVYRQDVVLALRSLLATVESTK